MVCSHGEAPCSSALLCVLLLVLIVTMTTGEINQIEEKCLQVGGICVERSSCPEQFTVNQTGLCPEQESKGAVCCHSVPESETSCRQHGGRCGQNEECKNVQSFGQLDCEDGYDCCLLIF